MNFNLEQLKRDNGQCLYYGKPAFAVLMPSGTLVMERHNGNYREFTHPGDPHLRNLPRKTLVQIWEKNQTGFRQIMTGAAEPSDGWTLKAQREIEDGEGL